MFLLSNLADHGLHLSDAMNSGNFKCICEGDAIHGVFCLTRRGNILAESGGKPEFAPAIVEACLAEQIPIGGVVGEWQLADAIWRQLQEKRLIERVTLASREPMYRLQLDKGADSLETRVRPLRPEDFGAWEPLNTAYLHEEQLPLQGSLEERQENFAAAASTGRWWGLWEDDELTAIGGLNAVYKDIGQVGGLYTIPGKRRAGLATTLMQKLIDDSANALALSKLILFTGDTNIAAQRLYESLGFNRMGDFALLFGTPSERGGRKVVNSPDQANGETRERRPQRENGIS